LTQVAVAEQLAISQTGVFDIEVGSMGVDFLVARDLCKLYGRNLLTVMGYISKSWSRYKERFMDPTWHGLRIGDWGTWLAGGATLLAVVVAIAVPWVLEHRRRKELARQAERSAHILAIELYEPLKRLHDTMTACRSVLGGRS